MKKILSFYLLVVCISSVAQTTKENVNYSNYVTPEFLLGKTAEPNDSFPSVKATKAIIISLGKNTKHKTQEWAYRLKYPRTGISLGVTDLGDTELVGQAFSLEPYFEVGFLRRTIPNLNLHAGLGLIYFNKKYDPVTNFYNRGVTTNLTWGFKLFFYYELLKRENYTIRLGGGYRHQSNGHTKLPNQGFNSFLGSISTQINYNKRTKPSEAYDEENNPFQRTIQRYLNTRVGIGQQAFALAFNDRREVYSLAISTGNIYNKTLRVGGGLYYRFYEHYYDYIQNNESLVQEGREFESYKDNPIYNASNLGIFGEMELQLNHVAFDINLGFNILKPAYKIDWRINEGWANAPRDLPESWMFGEFTTKYKLKQYISSRLGIKYYFIGTDNAPTHNFYIGAHLNSNLGQADFTEIELGYVYAFKPKNRGVKK